MGTAICRISHCIKRTFTNSPLDTMLFMLVTVYGVALSAVSRLTTLLRVPAVCVAWLVERCPAESRLPGS